MRTRAVGSVSLCSLKILLVVRQGFLSQHSLGSGLRPGGRGVPVRGSVDPELAERNARAGGPRHITSPLLGEYFQMKLQSLLGIGQPLIGVLG